MLDYYKILGVNMIDAIFNRKKIKYLNYLLLSGMLFAFMLLILGCLHKNNRIKTTYQTLGGKGLYVDYFEINTS